MVCPITQGDHNYCNTTKNNILFIDVSASHGKPSSRLTSGAGRQCKSYVRAEKTRAAIICNKSAITDHVCNENHVIEWENAKVIDRESDKAGDS